MGGRPIAHAPLVLFNGFKWFVLLLHFEQLSDPQVRTRHASQPGNAVERKDRGVLSMMFGFELLVIVLVGAAVWAIVSATRKTGTRTAGGSAQEILDARLARGELSVEEYKKLRETLGQGT